MHELDILWTKFNRTLPERQVNGILLNYHEKRLKSSSSGPFDHETQQEIIDLTGDDADIETPSDPPKSVSVFLPHPVKSQIGLYYY